MPNCYSGLRSARPELLNKVSNALLIRFGLVRGDILQNLSIVVVPAGKAVQEARREPSAGRPIASTMFWTTPCLAAPLNVPSGHGMRITFRRRKAHQAR